MHVCVCMQEVGAFAADPQPTTTTHTAPTCSPNLGGSVADPDYDNPSFSILNSTDLSQSPSLTLALLLEAWPVNSYPYVVQLPTGSVFVAAGIVPPGSCVCLFVGISAYLHVLSASLRDCMHASSSGRLPWICLSVFWSVCRFVCISTNMLSACLQTCCSVCVCVHLILSVLPLCIEHLSAQADAYHMQAMDTQF